MSACRLRPMSVRVLVTAWGAVFATMWLALVWSWFGERADWIVPLIVALWLGGTMREGRVARRLSELLEHCLPGLREEYGIGSLYLARNHRRLLLASLDSRLSANPHVASLADEMRSWRRMLAVLFWLAPLAAVGSFLLFGTAQ